MWVEGKSAEEVAADMLVNGSIGAIFGGASGVMQKQAAINTLAKELRAEAKECGGTQTPGNAAMLDTPKTIPTKTVNGDLTPDITQSIPTNGRQPNLGDDVRPSGKEGNPGAKVEDSINPNGSKTPVAAGGKIPGSTDKSRVLWSGGRKAMDAAAEYAIRNGYKTLEQTTTGRLLNTCQDIANNILGNDKAQKLMSPLWDTASARFVKGADGVIHAFLNSHGISDTSCFMRIEYEIAKRRGIRMVFHLVK